MATDSKMLALVANHVLPEHQQQQHHYNNRPGKLDRALADRPMQGRLREQYRFGRSDCFTVDDDWLSAIDGQHRRRNPVAHLIPSLFGLRLVVFKIGNDKRTKYLAQKPAVIWIVFRRPNQLL